MAYMDLAVFYEVIVPLMEMKASVMIGISTPIDSFSFFHKMLELKYPESGEYVFNRYCAQLICRVCLKHETNAEECNHMLYLIPPWKDAKNLEIVKLIFGDKVSTMKRESMGVATDEGDSIIKKNHIERLRKTCWTFEEMTKPRYVLVFADPNAGGENHLAIMAMAFCSGRKIIISMDSHPFHDVPDQQKMLDAHFSAIKMHPYFSRANIVFIPERNTGHEGGHMKLIADKYGAYTYRERQDRDYGMWTDPQNKIDSADRARVAMAEGSVHLMKDFITVNPFHEKTNETERRTAMVDEFLNQLMRLRFVYNKSKTPFGKNQKAVSGKTDKNGNITSGVNDDLAVCFCFLILINQLIITKELKDMDYSCCPDAYETQTDIQTHESYTLNDSIHSNKKIKV